MKYFLFDLDGTLSDPAIGITNSVMYALKKFGIEENDREKLYSFIGPPLLESFADKYGFDKEKANLGIKYFREYFVEKGMYENKLYDGIKEVLFSLRQKGKILGVATSKPEELASKILDNFGLTEYFDFLCGAEMDENGRCKKDDVLSYAINKHSIDTKNAVMTGDRKFDIMGGKKFGLYTVGVSYGYAEEGELEEANADMIANSTEELKKILLSL